MLPRKRLMWATFISAGVGGIDTGFIGLVISGVVAFVLALVAAMAIGTRKDEGGKALNISVD